MNASKPVARAVSLLSLLLLLTAVSSPAAAARGGEAGGKVIEVRGDRVRIALDKGGAAKIGNQVEIYTADAQLAGFWLVVETKPGEVTAAKVEAVTTPRVGWKARVYDAATVESGSTPPPWEADKPVEPAPSGRPDSGQDIFDKAFGAPPPGAFVSTKGYLVKLPDGRFQDGFDNFQRWAAARGPSRDEMLQSYRKWKSGGSGPFLGLWVEPNNQVMSQIYAMAPGGLIVLGVCPGTAAEKAGLRAGDIILKVNGKFVRDPAVLSETAGTLALEVERDSMTEDITWEAERHD